MEGAAAIVLGCVKRKRAVGSPAADLYRSPLWERRRRYAEASGLPWFIFSARHGLICPDERIEPYDVAMRDVPGRARRILGEQAAQRLQADVGPLAGRLVEVHAGALYVDALREPVERRGGSIVVPTAGLGIGQQLRWYRAVTAPTGGEQQRRRMATPAEVEAALVALDGMPEIASAGEARGPAVPGLYSWWVDEAGAAMLSAGIGAHVAVGRIYAGQTGATKWPSGRAGGATLRSRLSQHLRGRIEGSTFRLTLASVLRAELGLVVVGKRRLSPEGEAALTDWIAQHLMVATHAFPDPNPLADLEHQVLDRLDPPLNLDGRPASNVRARLRRLRAELSAVRPRRESS